MRGRREHRNGLTQRRFRRMLPIVMYCRDTMVRTGRHLLAYREVSARVALQGTTLRVGVVMAVAMWVLMACTSGVEPDPSRCVIQVALSDSTYVDTLTFDPAHCLTAPRLP